MSGVVLVAFGIAAIVLSVIGGNTVNTNLRNEYITGTPDMTYPERDPAGDRSNQVGAAENRSRADESERPRVAAVHVHPG